MDGAAADYTAITLSSTATMFATTPYDVSELTSVWTGSTANDEARIPSEGLDLIDDVNQPPPPTATMETMLDALLALSATAMPPSELKKLANDIGPSLPVAMTDAVTMDEDTIIKRRVGGSKTPGLELMHDPVRSLPPIVVEGGTEDSFLEKSDLQSSLRRLLHSIFLGLRTTRQRRRKPYAPTCILSYQQEKRLKTK